MKIKETGNSILILSVRNLRKQAANSILFEFEDLIHTFQNTLIYAPTFEHVFSRKAYRTIKKFSSSNHLAQTLSRYPTVDILDDDYELILVVIDNVYQLHLLNHIKGWRNCKAKKACFLAELWPGSLNDPMVLREPFQDYDHIFVGFSNAVSILREKLGVSCSYLPVGVDTKLFSSPLPNPARPIDIAYLGRRRQEIHNQLLLTRDKNNLFYLYDTAMGMQVEDHIQHRNMYSDILKRSKCAVAYPAKMNLGSYTNNVVEIGWRYFEFAAAGSIILGATPQNENFDTYFGWEDSVIDVPDTSFSHILRDLLRDEARRLQLEQTNRRESLLRNDWVYRWLEILKQFSIEPSQQALNRVNQLKAAANASS